MRGAVCVAVKGVGLGGEGGGGQCWCSSSTPGPLHVSHVAEVAVVAEEMPPPTPAELHPLRMPPCLAHALGAAAAPAGPAALPEAVTMAVRSGLCR